MKPTDESVIRKALTGYDVALAAFGRVLNEAQQIGIELERLSLFNYGATHCDHRELGGKCLAQVRTRTCAEGHEVAI